ncbi:hypothetical protein [Mesorhizobium sp.]|uniref:hypothetical protein n=1 Tax=Mesorhizobium sp. TaxID=1871066 RepID=UPI00257AC8E5|nr:hypothetical protein [Mesorhizobium sp.]
MQLSLGRDAGPVVDPDYRPYSADDLLEPSWVRREPDAVKSLPEIDLSGNTFWKSGFAEVGT